MALPLSETDRLSAFTVSTTARRHTLIDSTDSTRNIDGASGSAKCAPQLQHARSCIHNKLAARMKKKTRTRGGTTPATCEAMNSAVRCWEHWTTRALKRQSSTCLMATTRSWHAAMCSAPWDADMATSGPLTPAADCTHLTLWFEASRHVERLRFERRGWFWTNDFVRKSLFTWNSHLQ